MDSSKIERFAIRMARGDKINRWPKHCEEDTKDQWRSLALEIVKDMCQESYDEGYKKGKEDAEEAFKQVQARKALRALRNR
jgi:hypothetical protein